MSINYTLFQLLEDESILVSKTLKTYSSLLEEFNFLRISRSYLINLNHVNKYGRPPYPYDDEWSHLTCKPPSERCIIERIEIYALLEQTN